MVFSLVLALLVSSSVSALKIVITNDDGWATAQIRAQYQTLKLKGHDVILSCPAINQSGTGSSSKTPTVLTDPCEFNSCPVGSPAIGFNASDPFINYVNAYPVDAVKYGIQTRSAALFDSFPDLVVSGPNIGDNLGIAVLFSGTVGAAAEATKEGIPSIAFSSVDGDAVSYTTLTSDPSSSNTRTVWITSLLTTQFIDAITANPGTILPPGISINVNYGSTTGCNVADYQWVLSRIFWNPFNGDVTTCGSDHLPTESSVINTAGCYVSVSVFNADSKLDANETAQQYVLNRMPKDFFSCL